MQRLPQAPSNRRLLPLPLLLSVLVVLLGPHARRAAAAPDDWNAPPPPLPYPAESPLVDSEAVGTLQGSQGVGPTGDFTYRLPLDAPPGRAGMSPALAIVYGSRAGNGLLGVGFSLEGFSEIRRCHKSWAVEGFPDGIDFDASDRFCLDGKKLVQINPEAMPYGGDGAEYRTEQESFARIRSHGDGGRGPDGFTVWAKGGRVFHYSTVIESKRLTGDPSPQAPPFEDALVKYAWLLTDVEDRSGNAIHYSYEQTPAFEELQWGIDYVPSAIDYTLKGSEPGGRRVTFDYKPRPEPLTSYVSGVKIETTRRLTAINFYAPDPYALGSIKPAFAWSYALTYEDEPSPDTGRSRLSTIQKCDLNACQRAKHFEWWQLGGAPPFEAATLGPSFQVDETAPSFLHVFDANGDGLDDLLYQLADGLSAPPAPIYLRLAEKAAAGGLAFGPEIHVNAPGHLFAATDLARSRPVDHDGDGAWELFAAVDPSTFDPSLVESGQLLEAGYLMFRWSPAAQSFEPAYGNGTVFFPESPESDVAQLIDADGDGRLDLFRVLTPESGPTPGPAWFFYRGSEAGLGAPQPTGLPAVQARFARALDLDGDGRGELLPVDAATVPGGSSQGPIPGSTLALGLDDGNGLATSTRWTLDRLGFLELADLNGDGLKDALFPANAAAGGEIVYRFNEGRGFGSLRKMAHPVWHGGLAMSDPGRRAADFDGDGADDLLTFNEVSASGEPTVRLHLSRGGSFAPAVDLGFPSGVSHPQEGWTTAKLGDFDGDGLTDVASFVQTGTWQDASAVHPMVKLRLLRQNRGSPAVLSDKLFSISDEGNPAPATLVFYAQDASVSAAKPASVLYPRVAIRQGLPVVRMLGVAAGGPTPLWRWKVYSYEAPVIDVRGRGFLGFGTVREFDLQTRAETVTTFDHTSEVGGVYPFAGVPRRVTHVAPIFPVATDPGIEFPPLPKGPIEARVVETTYHHEVEWSWPHVYSVRPHDIQTQTWEQPVEVEGYGVRLTGAPHDERSVLQSFQYDAFGNTTYASSLTAGVALYSNTITAYENRETDWLLGLPISQTTVAYDEDDLAPEPRRVDYAHDAKGRLLRTTVEPAHPELALATELLRNDDGLVTRITRSSIDGARATFFAYDPAERMFVRAAWNDLGHAHRAVHDPALGVPVLTRDPNGAEVRYHYDRFGRVRHIDPDGGMPRSISYTSAGCQLPAAATGTCIEVTTPDHGRQLTYVDEHGRAWETATRGFKGELAWSRSAYNVLGQPTLAGRPFAGPPPVAPDPLAPLGPATVTQYDSLGRLLSLVEPNGATTRWSPSMAMTTRTDPEGRLSFVRRDLAGRVYHSAAIGDDGSAVSTWYSHGPFNQVDWILEPDKQSVVLDYDKLGRPTLLDDPDLGVRSFEYDAFGDLKAVTDEIHAVSYERDELGRVRVRRERHEVNGIPAIETALFLYDQGPFAKGRLSSASALAPDDTSTAFEYDAAGHPTKTEWTVQGSTFAIETTYDALGRPDLLRYPTVPGEPPAARFALRHQYNQAGYLNAVGIPDADPPQPAIWRVKARALDGQLTAAAWQNGVTETRQYEPATGRLEQIWTVGNADLFGLHYDYFPDGNVRTRTDLLGGRAEAFEYDALDRLKSVTLASTEDSPSSHERVFEYDDIHRLTRVLHDGSEKETFFHDDPVHRRALSGMVAMSGEQPTFVYDARGRQESGGGRHIQWTSYDLPRLIEGPAGATFFTYDPFGTRVRKTTGAEETITIGGLYERRTGQGAVTHVFYVHGTEGPVAQLVRRTTAAGTTAAMEYLQRDAHGSVGLVFDGKGKEVPDGRVYFNPFGQRTGEAGEPTAAAPGDVMLGFTGHRHDGELGLVDMGGRVYDPSQRRFLTPDPLVADPLFGPAYNRYAYALNNPIRYTDPSGFEVVPTSSVANQPLPAVTGCGFEAVGACGEGAPPPRSATPRANAIPSSTGSGLTPPTGGTSSWGPAMSDVPAFDAEKTADDEVSAGTRLWNTLARMDNAAGLMHQGLTDRGPEMIVEMGILAINATSPPAADWLGVRMSFTELPPTPEVSGNEIADQFLNVVPIVRIVGGFGRAGSLFLDGDYEGTGRALAEPEAEVAGIALGVGLGGGPRGGGTPRAYSVAFEAKIEPTGFGSRPAHFGAANAVLLRGMAQDPGLAAGIRNLIPDFETSTLTPSGRVLGVSPPEWTWHHVPGRPGVLQLVPRVQHANGSLFQPLLHPNGIGGFAEWGSKF